MLSDALPNLGRIRRVLQAKVPACNARAPRALIDPTAPKAVTVYESRSEGAGAEDGTDG